MRKVVFIFFLTTNLIAQEIKVSSIQDLYKKGNIALDSTIFEQANTYYYSGLSIANKIKNDSLIAKGNFYLGEYFSKTESYIKSLDFFNKSLLVFKSIDDKTNISKCYRKIGGLYKKRGDYENALFHVYESLKINEFLKNENQIAKDLNTIGNLYSRSRDFDAAENRLKKALELNKKNNNLKGVVNNISTLGAVYQRIEKFEKAIEYYEKALVYADSLGLKRNKSILLGNIGSTSRSLKKYNQSLEYLFKALVIKKELKRNGSTAHTLSDISETYLHMSEFINAKKYALESIKFAKNENLELERYAYFLLSKSNYNLGRYKESYNNLSIFNKLNDSIFNINKAATINELNIRYDTEKRNLKIKAQESNIALLDEKNKVKNQWLLFGGLGLLSIFGIVLLWRSREAARNRELLQEQFSQDLLSAQEEERTRVSKDLHDSVGQQLTLIKRKAQNLEQKELATLTNSALEEVRSISRGLFPATLKQLGLTESIQQLLNDLDSESDMFFSVEIDDIDHQFNEAATLNFYRFIQESVTNALKHSKAKTLTVNIVKEDNTVEVLIKDNGVGFDNVTSLKQHSLGLKTIAERIRMLKGVLSIKSKKGQGTQIISQIPIT